MSCSAGGPGRRFFGLGEILFCLRKTVERIGDNLLIALLLFFAREFCRLLIGGGKDAGLSHERATAHLGWILTLEWREEIILQNCISSRVQERIRVVVEEKVRGAR